MREGVTIITPSQVIPNVSKRAIEAGKAAAPRSRTGWSRQSYRDDYYKEDYRRARDRSPKSDRDEDNGSGRRGDKDGANRRRRRS